MRTTKRLSKEKGGNTLIEFALLAPVFFMLVMGLVEFVLYQYKIYALNHVTYEATRTLLTGKAQTSSDVAKTFHDAVCKAAGPMIDCNDIVFDVRSFDKISDITYPPVQFDDKGNPTNFSFQPGGANKYTVVRSAIHHQFVTPFMDRLFQMGPNMPAIATAYSIVKGEPWE